MSASRITSWCKRKSEFKLGGTYRFEFPEDCLQRPEQNSPYTTGTGIVNCSPAVCSRWNRVDFAKSQSRDKHGKLWRDLLSDPSRWWDQRSRKGHPNQPDFKHRQTGEVLWLDDRRTPPWVASEIASLGSVTFQLQVSSSIQRLSRYTKARQHVRAMKLFEQMQEEGIAADHYIFLHVLNACAALRALAEGRRIHEQIVDAGCELNLYLSNSLVDMYAKCGSLDDARNVFKKMPTRDVVSWNSMILGCVKCGRGPEALELCGQMQREEVEPNSTTFVAFLSACTSVGAIEEGKRIHKKIARSGFESNPYIGAALVDMYAKCGTLEDARNVFEKITTPDVVCWNTMILGCVKFGQGLEALDLFKQMQREKIQPSSSTFIALLTACTSLAALEDGRRVHKEIIRSGCDSDLHVGNSLVDMYAKCGSIEDAQSVCKMMPTRDVVSWTALIVGQVKCGQGPEALKTFQQMQKEGVKPNSTTFVALINACASMSALEEGGHIHNQIIQSECDSHPHVGASLVDMYAKCGSIEDAKSVFNKMPIRDVVSWNALILGSVKCGQGREALDLFKKMQWEEVEADSGTYVALLNACASIAALAEGKSIHRQITQSGCEFNTYVGSSLVDMYVKCGSLEDARSVFERLPTRDMVSWTAMIMGYAIHGQAKEAVASFEQMVLEGVEMNELAFVCLLSACSHGGLVMEGVYYFESMRSVYGIPPGLEHYTCMVDLLGRAGHLEEAENIVKTMPFEPCSTVWMSLLSACRIHGNVEIGERVTKQLLKSNPENAAGFELFSHTHDDAAGHFEIGTGWKESVLSPGGHL